MVGFSLKPKDDKTPKNPGFEGFSLRKTVSKTKLPTKVKQFGIHEEDEEFKEVKIDTFDSEKGGAFHEDDKTIEAKKSPLVIQNLGNQNWRKIAKERFNSTQKLEHQDTEKVLEYGINFADIQNAQPKHGNHISIIQRMEADNFKEDVKNRPDVATIEEYEEIPVEDFGSAMLRGMGWKGEDNDEKKKSKVSTIPLVKRPPRLGLGAKAAPTNDPDRNPDRTYIPVKRINRSTGLEIPERQERDLSPRRNQGSGYRSRE